VTAARAAAPRALALAVLAALAACAAPTATPVAPRGSPGLVLAPEALLVAGTGQEIGFGRAPDNAIAAVSARTGSRPAADLTRSDCAAGPLREVRWPDGLSLWFRDRMLVGWSVEAPGAGRYATPSGLTPGLDRGAALALPGTAATGSGLSAGAIRGRVDAGGQVSRLDAGRTCG
jgi:hypothetical protein